MTHHRIQHFRCGQTKAQAFPNSGRRAADFAFIQLNPADWLNFLVVDVDREDALMCLMHPAVPEPTWVIENEATGHAQAGWAIEPVYRGQDARPHPIRYAAAVQRSLDRLVDGDPCFTRYLVRNPAAVQPAGRVWWGIRDTPWSLGALKAHMAEWDDPFHDEALDGPNLGAWNPGPEFSLPGGIPRVPVVDTATEVGRNTAVFRATRRWLWDQWETHHRAPTDATSIAHAQALNAQLPDPLPEAELVCLARSAVRQVNAGKGRPTATSRSDAAHEYLSRMGRRGGRARTEAKQVAAAANAAKGRRARSSALEQLRARALELRAAGQTLAAIAQAVGRSVRTVITWLKSDPTAPTSTPIHEGEIRQATGISSAAMDVPSTPALPAAASSTADTRHRPTVHHVHERTHAPYPGYIDPQRPAPLPQFDTHPAHRGVHADRRCPSTSPVRASDGPCHPPRLGRARPPLSEETSMIGTPLTAEQIKALEPWTHSPWPEHGSDGPVQSMPYGREPYVRAVLPTAIGPVTVDGKVHRYDRRTFILHREHLHEPVLNLWVPIELTRRIDRDESNWTDVRDIED